MTPARRSTGTTATSLPIPAVIWLAHRAPSQHPGSRRRTRPAGFDPLPLSPCPRPSRGQAFADDAYAGDKLETALAGRAARRGFQLLARRLARPRGTSNRCLDSPITTATVRGQAFRAKLKPAKFPASSLLRCRHSDPNRNSHHCGFPLRVFLIQSPDETISPAIRQGVDFAKRICRLDGTPHRRGSPG
jgi:hypothetical protein